MISPEYLAGFFDADGYVGVVKTKKWNYFGLRLVLINTDKFFLQSVQAQYGGSLTRKDYKKSKEHHKIGWHLSFYSNDAKRMSMMLLPFSRIKSSQLMLALQFPIGRKVMAGEFGAPKIDKVKQEEIYHQLTSIKKENRC